MKTILIGISVLAALSFIGYLVLELVERYGEWVTGNKRLKGK
jgi:hypothetical protein